MTLAWLASAAQESLRPQCSILEWSGSDIPADSGDSKQSPNKRSDCCTGLMPPGKRRSRRRRERLLRGRRPSMRSRLLSARTALFHKISPGHDPVHGQQVSAEESGEPVLADLPDFEI